jgi:hypothetical protein
MDYCSRSDSVLSEIGCSHFNSVPSGPYRVILSSCYAIQLYEL